MISVIRAGLGRRFRPRSSGALLAILLLSSPVCAEEVVQIGGTGTGIGVIKLLGAAYKARHPNVRIDVLPSMGTPGGIKAALDGAIGLAMAGRPLTPEEQAAGAKSAEFGRTPFVFVTHRAVGTEGITSDELVQIYSLKTVQWPGGEPIRLVLRPSREASSEIIRAMSPDMAKAISIALAKEGMIYAATDQDSADAVTRTPGSLGTSTLTQVITENLSVRVLKLNGVEPSARNLAGGTYTLFKPLYIVTTPRTTTAARQFADFVASREARRIIEKAGIIPGPL